MATTYTYKNNYITRFLPAFSIFFGTSLLWFWQAGRSAAISYPTNIFHPCQILAGALLYLAITAKSWLLDLATCRTKLITDSQTISLVAENNTVTKFCWSEIDSIVEIGTYPWGQLYELKAGDKSITFSSSIGNFIELRKELFRHSRDLAKQLIKAELSFSNSFEPGKFGSVTGYVNSFISALCCYVWACFFTTDIIVLNIALSCGYIIPQVWLWYAPVTPFGKQQLTIKAHQISIAGKEYPISEIEKVELHDHTLLQEHKVLSSALYIFTNDRLSPYIFFNLDNGTFTAYSILCVLIGKRSL